LEAFFVSVFTIALGEIGDKTQLLALLLSTRFRRPIPICLGILAATLANHLLAGVLGAWAQTVVSVGMLRWFLGLSFIAMAIWAVMPDKFEEGPSVNRKLGVFFITLAAFFMVEMGDKTQVATALLAAKYYELAFVVAGTTIGMLLADVPVIFLAERATLKIPLKPIRIIAAAIFALLGIGVLLQIDQWFFLPG